MARSTPMSGPSSDGRPSVSSEPSFASSRTYSHGEDSANGQGGSHGGDSAGDIDFARRRRSDRRSGGFLLDSPAPHAASRQLPRQSGRVGSRKEKQEAPRPHDGGHAAMDPRQIIDLALKLGESRRRNLSAGQLVAPQPQPAGSRRVPSLGVQDGAGGSLRQYLNEQRRASRNMSPLGGKHKKWSPSEDTLARAQKFRASVELRLEYLRLLEHLPPLRPDIYAPGNFTVKAENVPGSPHAFLTRIPSYAGRKHELGRPYNPLQYLRDSRGRARERKSLDPMPDDFADPNKVRDWVSRVQELSSRPDYRRQDVVALPPFHEDHARDAVPSKSTKHRMGWNFTVEELLADAVWLEQNGNKHSIEDRFGHKLFPFAEEPKKNDFLQPRASKEYPEKRRKSWVDSVSGTADPTTGDESDPTSERGRKRRLLPPFRAESPRHKRSWKGSVSRSRGFHSDSSDSETESRRARSKEPCSADTDPTINTGALGLHLKGMLEQEAKQASVNSPGVVSPDTPDKWGTGYRSNWDSSSPRSSMDVTGHDVFLQGELHDELRVPRGYRTRSSEPQPRSSFEDTASTPPKTPVHLKNLGLKESSSSPPSSRGGEIKNSLKSKLDLFRSDDGAKIPKHNMVKSETDPVDAEKKRPNRHPVEDGLGTTVKSLLSHKHNESITSVNSPKQHRDLKDPSSAVSRFFKGVKNEGSKVGEFIFKKDRPAEDSDSSAALADQAVEKSEDDDEDTIPVFKRSTTATTTDSIQTKNTGRYHVELPSFRSQTDQDGYTTDDPVKYQSRARANSRSPRFDKLAPPRMDLGSMSSKSSPAQSRTPSPELVRNRPRNNRLLYPDGPPRGYSITSLAESTFSDTSSRTSNTRFQRRHWSITDEDTNAHHRPRRRTATTAPGTIISSSDVARIRALFLASGVKAREIARRAHEKRDTPPAFLTDAAKAANADLIPIPRMEEHALAARILVRNLEASTTALQDSAETYRNQTVQGLTSTISALKSRVESQLFPRVRDAGDEALRITSEVSATAPLGVKQLSDEIDKMMRMRRRRMRWMRRVGWMLVEWTLLGIMWWVWLVVVAFRLVMRVLGGVWGVVRWLVWI